MPYVIQSVLFPRNMYTRTQANKWIRDHGMIKLKVDVTKSLLRYRQHDPNHFKKGTFRIKKEKDGIMFVVADFKLQGEGLYESIKSIPSYLRKKGLEYLHSRPRSITNFIKSHGSKKIIKFYICRAPITSAYKKIINYLSKGKLEEAKTKYNYDDVYHLYLVMVFEDNERYSIEKNEIIKIEKAKDNKNGTCIERPVNTTFNDLIDKSEKANKSLYRYTAWEYNCQNFVQTFANAAGIGPDVRPFVMQDYTSAFNTDLQKGAVTATDIYALLKRVTGGKN